MFSNSRITLERAALCCLALLLLAGTSARSASAATYYVPDDFVTIQSAYDTAADGDTILVQPGTYVENIRFHNKGIILKSLAGPEKTIIDGGGENSVIRIAHYSSSFLTDIEGFTITNGESWVGGGLWLDTRARGTMKNCIITGNHATGRGGGVYRYYGNYTFENTRIIGNTASIGGGIYCNMLGGVKFVDGVIAENHAELDGGGIALGYRWSSAQIINSFISNNTAGQAGGGVHVYQGNLQAYNVLIVGNSAVEGGGIYKTEQGNDSFVLTSNVTNTDNTAEVGGGFYFEEDSNSNNLVRLYNTIDYFNSTISVLADGSNIQYSNIEAGFAGPGNIDSDPLFVDAENGDYHLRSGSPSIDSGTSRYALAYDLEMNPRPHGAGYDMGAYEASGCNEEPMVEITSVSPAAIWPPNNKEVEVTVSGYVTVIGGCELGSATYLLADEYGVFADSGDLMLAADGSFEMAVTVAASRLGTDKDGRSYEVTIGATNEAGSTEASATTVVLHDQR